MKRLLLLFLTGWVCSGIGHAQAQDTLFISTSQTVHLRFSSELKYVNLGNKAIIAKIVDGSKDFVAVKAREPFDFCTSMSCLESTGAMHTFLVAYREHPSRLDVDTRIPAGGAHKGTGPSARMGTDGPAGDVRAQADTLSLSPSSLAEVAAKPQELYHIGVSDYGIQLLCENLFYKDDVLYLVVSVRNSSAVSYEMSTPRFAVESSRRTKRGLQYEKAIFPQQSYGLGSVAPSSVGRLVFTFGKIALVKGQVFRMYFYEKGGARNLVMTLNMDDVNKAKRI